jgi:sterol desaturase/sphingolipid hydroxylase (fatty acid hydroxylase superfamily)
MNAANSAHHPSEEFFRFPFLIPLALLIEMSVPQVIVLSTMLASWGQIVHSNTRISLGPLNYVMAWPMFHRVHHSLAPEHHDKNFGATFSFWDIIFRTAYFPKKDQTIRTGISENREPKNLREYLVRLAPR